MPNPDQALIQALQGRSQEKVNLVLFQKIIEAKVWWRKMLLLHQEYAKEFHKLIK